MKQTDLTASLKPLCGARNTKTHIPRQGTQHTSACTAETHNKMFNMSLSSPLKAYWKTLNQVLQKLSQRLSLMSQGEESIVKVSLNASSDKLVAFKTKPPPIQKDILSICNDPYTLAQQLTHVELVRKRRGRGRESRMRVRKRSGVRDDNEGGRGEVERMSAER